MSLVHAVLERMVAFYEGDARRIQHFMKVWGYAKWIGESERLDAETQLTLEVAAFMHDIGIRPAERKFGSDAGKLQEQEGPAPAREMLEALGVDEPRIARVCYLIAHHHTYQNVDGIDYRILLEADFLVNLYEENASQNAIRHALQSIFRTEGGTKLCRTMFAAE